MLGHVSLKWLGQVKLLLSQIKGQHTFYLSVSPEASTLSAPLGLSKKKILRKPYAHGCKPKADLLKQFPFRDS